jgi:hypothetical protein
LPHRVWHRHRLRLASDSAIYFVIPAAAKRRAGIQQKPCS